MIRLTVDFKDAKKFDQLIRYIENAPFVRIEAETANIADKTVNDMIQTIEDNRKQPARPGVSKLQNSIDWTQLINDPGKELVIGIGNIANMTKEAPYWEMINDGATYITKKTHVVPTTFFASPDSEFVTFKEGSSHTITGIDYIGKAIRNLDKELREMMSKWGTEFIGGAQKASEGHFGSTFIKAWGTRVTFKPEGKHGAN
jgi:hypothetical protein